jgi:ribose 5-phosphate isomerase RpiB
MVANYNPNDNSVAGVRAAQVSDTLRARGTSRLNCGNKMVISRNGRFTRVGRGA